MKPIIDKYIILAKSVAVAFVVAFVACLTAVAQERTDTVSYRYIPLSQEEIDSLVPKELLSPQPADTVVAQKEVSGPFTSMLKRDTKFLRYLDRLATGNKDRSFEKKFDVNFIVMPSYTREGSFGIGGGATGLYRLDRTDSIMQPSDITLIGNVTLNGFFALTASGNTHFPGRRLRYSYKLEYTYSPLDFWGISREACGLNPKIDYTRNQLKYTSDLMYLMTGNYDLGAYTDEAKAPLEAIAAMKGQLPAYGDARLPYLMAQYVTAFELETLDSCIVKPSTKSEDEMTEAEKKRIGKNYFTNPLTIHVNMEFEYEYQNGKVTTRQMDDNVSVRNRLDSVYIQRNDGKGMIKYLRDPGL